MKEHIKHAMIALAILVVCSGPLAYRALAQHDAIDGILDKTFRDQYTFALSPYMPWATKTAAYTMTTTDYGIVCNTQGGAFTVTLPNPTTTPVGQTWAYVRGGTGTNACTLSAAPYSIMGSTTFASMDAFGDGCIVVNTGSNYALAGRNIQ